VVGQCGPWKLAVTALGKKMCGCGKNTSAPGTSAQRILAIIFAAILFSFAPELSHAMANDAANLITNSDLKAHNGAVPTNWKTESLPPCGARLILHSNHGASDEFEIANDRQVESQLEQNVDLKPGWYRFTADIKVETLGSEGAPPELFARVRSLPVQTRTHPLGWSDGWRNYGLNFKVGAREHAIAVGFALGDWGSPNTGRIFFRNPKLVPTTKPHSLEEASDLETYDLDHLTESRFGPGAEEAYLPAQYLSGARWTVALAYLGLLMVAVFGWWAISPGQAKRQP
jgi:hypothetical protein